MVNHLPGHAAVHHQHLPVDKAVGRVTEKEGRPGNIARLSHPSRRMLAAVGLPINRLRASGMAGGGVNPTGRNGVDPHPAPKAGCHGMGQGGDAALGGRVALGVRLGLKRPGRGDVEHRRSFPEYRQEQRGQVIGRRHAYLENLIEILPAASRQQSPIAETGVVYQHVHPAIPVPDSPGKGLQYPGISGITCHEEGIRRGLLKHREKGLARLCVPVKKGNAGAFCGKCTAETTADAQCAAGHHHNPILKSAHDCLLFCQ